MKILAQEIKKKEWQKRLAFPSKSIGNNINSKGFQKMRLFGQVRILRSLLHIKAAGSPTSSCKSLGNPNTLTEC